jgi:hypothetical protein
MFAICRPMNDFELAKDEGGGCMLGYPTFKLTEDQMVKAFGKPNSSWSYVEPDKGYTGCWCFQRAGIEISVAFRWDTARFSGMNEDLVPLFDAFLKESVR